MARPRPREEKTRSPGPARLALAVVVRSLLLFTAWLAVSEGSASGLAFGALASATAATASVALLPPPLARLNWRALPGFIALYLLQMLQGGVDVARRAFHPQMPLQPALTRRHFRLESEAARLLFTLAAGLLPGTVSVEMIGDELELHVLDERLPLEETLSALENRVAALFGERPFET